MAGARVVLDTNVVVSAHLKGDGLERFVCDLALAGEFRLFVSRRILSEYRGVLGRPKFLLTRSQLARTMALIQKKARLVEPNTRLSITWDEDDNKFLECAEAANADFLVTGNKRHFTKTWGQTRIVTAKKLLLLWSV